MLLPLLEHAVVNFVHARDHFHQPPQGAHAFDQAHLLQEVGKIKRRLLQLFLHFFNISEFNLFLRLLHQREHITHPEDATRHPLGMKRLESLNFFARTDEFDRLTAHFANRQRRATPGIAIELGEHSSGDSHLIVEGTGELCRLLTNHRIHHQQHLIGLYGTANPHHLLHHLGVDLQTASGIDQQGVVTLLFGLCQTGSGDVLRLGLDPKTEHIHTDLSAEGLQLLNRSRTVHIGTNH